MRLEDVIQTDPAVPEGVIEVRYPDGRREWITLATAPTPVPKLVFDDRFIRAMQISMTSDPDEVTRIAGESDFPLDPAFLRGQRQRIAWERQEQEHQRPEAAQSVPALVLATFDPISALAA